LTEKTNFKSKSMVKQVESMEKSQASCSL